MRFQLIGEITDIEIIAVGNGSRIRSLLQQQYGRGDWRKLKGFAVVRLANGMVRHAEVHWFAAHGIGKRKTRMKRYLD